MSDRHDAIATTPLTTVTPSAWQLGWRQLLRDFRAGELRLLVVAVTLAVGALTAVGFFADRINGGLARDARSLLGGDAIVASDLPAPPAFVGQGERARPGDRDHRQLPEHGPRARQPRAARRGWSASRR